MLNYWWVTRPKRKLDSVPEVLTVFSEISLNQEWQGQVNTQISLEDALEQAGLKRVGTRRDQGGSGARTYAAWLESLGLIFRQGKDGKGNIKLTLAGEAIMSGDSPVDVLKNQVLKYQFPSTFSISRGVKVSPRFRIRPFRFLLKLLSDSGIQYLTQEEIGRVVAVNAENESDKCYNEVVNKIQKYRQYGTASLDPEFFTKYGPSRGGVNLDHPYSHLDDMANTMINWLEYTQLCKRNDEKHLVILEEKKEEVRKILNQRPAFIDRPENHEFFQRKYGLDPKHRKDTRNLEKTKSITPQIIAENKIKQAYIIKAGKEPIAEITAELISSISDSTGIQKALVEDTLNKLYPHGSIGSFLVSYFEMAFKGRDEAVDFEEATTKLFRQVFHYDATHLGQTGPLSAPDVLLISDNEGYQAIIDNKAYAKYELPGDHRNRMIHNYIEKVSNYSDSDYPVAFFSYISGGFSSTFTKNLQQIIKESKTNGSGITVSTFIKMIKNQQSGEKTYSHAELKKLFGINRQIYLQDI